MNISHSVIVFFSLYGFHENLRSDDDRKRSGSGPGSGQGLAGSSGTGSEPGPAGGSVPGLGPGPEGGLGPGPAGIQKTNIPNSQVDNTQNYDPYEHQTDASIQNSNDPVQANNNKRYYAVFDLVFKFGIDYSIVQ